MSLRLDGLMSIKSANRRKPRLAFSLSSLKNGPNSSIVSPIPSVRSSVIRTDNILASSDLSGKVTWKGEVMQNRLLSTTPGRCFLVDSTQPCRSVTAEDSLGPDLPLVGCQRSQNVAHQ